MQLINATEWLFFHLWKTNPKTKESCPNINIPYTIFYNWGQPWTGYKTQSTKIDRLEKDKIKIYDFSCDVASKGPAEQCGLQSMFPVKKKDSSRK